MKAEKRKFQTQNY